MIITCIGDSLTEGDYGIYGKKGIANVQIENYPYFLQKMTNAEVRNYGKCGSRATDYRKYYEAGCVDVKGSDIILVMLGTNGGMDDEVETQGNEAYRTLICHMEKDEPKAKIILCTPPHVTVNQKYSNCGYALQVEKAVKFVRKYATSEGKLLIDTANCPYFTSETEVVMQPNDGLHFGREGYKKLAEYIVECLEKLYDMR